MTRHGIKQELNCEMDSSQCSYVMKIAKWHRCLLLPVRKKLKSVPANSSNPASAERERKGELMEKEGDALNSKREELELNNNI